MNERTQHPIDPPGSCPQPDSKLFMRPARSTPSKPTEDIVFSMYSPSDALCEVHLALLGLAEIDLESQQYSELQTNHSSVLFVLADYLRIISTTMAETGLSLPHPLEGERGQS